MEDVWAVHRLRSGRRAFQASEALECEARKWDPLPAPPDTHTSAPVVSIAMEHTQPF